MEWIGNQPVLFGENTTCSCDEGEYVQLVHNSDVSQVQFTCEPCPSSPQLIDNYQFTSGAGWDLSSGWSIADFQLCHTGLTLASAVNDYVYTDGKYYQFNFSVDSISVGAEYRVYCGLTLIGTITSTGDWSFYGYCAESLGTTQLTITPIVEGSSICISEFTSFEILQNAIICVYNQEGVYQTEISFNSNPEKFEFVKNTVTITIDWAELGLSNGCYYIGLLNPCVNTGGQNYPAQITDWTDSTNWVYDGDVDFPGSSITFDTEVLGEGFFFEQQNVFNSFTTEYCITITVSIIGSLDVYFGNTLVETITTTGGYVITGIPSGTFSLRFVNSEFTEATGQITSLSACTVDPADYVVDITSNTFKLGDYSSNCTLLINACNNEDGLGFVFEGSGFTPRLRLEAKLKNAKYTNERSIYEDSVGKKKVTYYSRRKQKVLAIDLQPEYIHDFLSTLLGFDNVYINNSPYIVDDEEYNIEYSDASDDVGSVNLLVSEKTQNVKNTNCSDDENVCTLPPNYLLRADTLSDNIVLCDGGRIVISG